MSALGELDPPAGIGSDRRLGTRVFIMAHEPIIGDAGYSRLGHLAPALDRQMHLVGHASPATPRLIDLLLKVRHVHPDRIAWRERAWLNAARFRFRTRAAAAELARAEEHDVVLQLQTMFGLGPAHAKPYAIYTDNLLSLTRRYYPTVSRLRSSEARRFTELEADVCRGAAALFPWSEFVGRAMVEDYGCDPGRIFVTPAAPRFPASPLHRSWGSHMALFVGSDFERKGGTELLAVWPAVRREIPDARLCIVGPAGRPPRLPAGVDWIGPLADPTGLAKLYSRADVFAMPSRYEAWGLAFQEAMAHGTACISGDFGAQPELVRDGLSGRNVPGGDARALADSLIEILGDRRLAERLGRGGWAQVRACDWNSIAAKMAPRLAAIAA